MKVVSKKSVRLTTDEQRIVSVSQVLGDTTRYKIVKLMLGGEEMCVSEIAQTLAISVSAVSQHFRIFEKNNLVTKNRYGQKVCYRLRENNLTSHLTPPVISKEMYDANH